MSFLRKAIYTLVHCLLHCFAYWLPCAVKAVIVLLLCRPCRNRERHTEDDVRRSRREVLLIHHPDLIGTAVDAFGLAGVVAPALEGQQCCVGNGILRDHAENAAWGPPHISQDQCVAGGGAAAAVAAAVPAASPGSTDTTTSASAMLGHEPAGPRIEEDSFLVKLSRAWPFKFLVPSSLDEESDRDSDGSRRPSLTSASVHRSSHSAPRPAVQDRVIVSLADAGSATPSPEHGPTATATTNPPREYARTRGGSPVNATLNRAVPRGHRPDRLLYDAPLYGPHVETIMGSLRPSPHIPYTREEWVACDGCVVAMDWWYLDGEKPRAHDHERVSRARRAAGNTAAVHPIIPTASTNERPVDGSTTLPFASAQEPLEPFQMELERDTSAEVEVGRDPHHHDLEGATAEEAIVTCAPVERSSRARGLLFILPGLSSYAQTRYVRHFVRSMHAAGFHVCVLNTRGMGDTPSLTTSFLFNGAYTRDTRDCLQKFFTKAALVARLGRQLPVIGIGLSMGGVTLSKYLGEQGMAGLDPFLDAAMCCCSPVDFAKSTEFMHRSCAQRLIYQPDMCRSIHTYIWRHKPLHHLPHVDHDWVFAKGNIHRFRRVLQFDEHIIAKTAGYASVHHYHTDASVLPWLRYVTVPTLVLSAADDPVLGPPVMPHRWREVVHQNALVVYAEPPVGGHLGFLGNPREEFCGQDNWLEVFVRERAAAVCARWYQAGHLGDDRKEGLPHTAPVWEGALTSSIVVPSEYGGAERDMRQGEQQIKPDIGLWRGVVCSTHAELADHVVMREGTESCFHAPSDVGDPSGAKNCGAPAFDFGEEIPPDAGGPSPVTMARSTDETRAPHPAAHPPPTGSA